ncbi:hypothetical protein [Nocardioides sp.]|uniref:hypothetical protein n=1 Tax=Nocardioides sp. TaxID=35761 RepID=UPI003D0B4CB1
MATLACAVPTLWTSPWLVVIALAIGFTLGLGVAAFQWPETDADGPAARRSKQRAAFRRTEPALAWAAATAVAPALALALIAAQWHTWRSAVCEADWTVSVFGVSFCLVMGGMVFIGAVWLRSGRTTHRPNSTTDYPVTHFNLRQSVVITPLLLAVMQCVTGIAAVADAAQQTAADSSGGALPAQQILHMVDLRRDYFTFLSAVILVVVVIVVLIAIAQTALLSYFASPQLRKYYRTGDPLVFGVMLSAVLAVVLIPSWGVLQDAGHRMVSAHLGQVPLDLDWFTWSDQLNSMLAPSIGPAAVITALLGILAPVATALITDRATHLGKKSTGSAGQRLRSARARTR